MDGTQFVLDGATYRSANITPDEATGIGSWSPDEIATTLRTGAEPDGVGVALERARPAAQPD